MSMLLTLTSCAVVAAFTLTQSALAAVAIAQDEETDAYTEEGIPTVFADDRLLIEALQGFDCHVTQLSQNELLVHTAVGNLRYARADAGQNFRLFVNDITDVDALYRNLRSLEVDYGRNVQAYTYAHIKENLAPGMTVSEDEVDDDGVLYLTIDVE